jgi:hypothetical protein
MFRQRHLVFDSTKWRVIVMMMAHPGLGFLITDSFFPGKAAERYQWPFYF